MRVCVCGGGGVEFVGVQSGRRNPRGGTRRTKDALVRFFSLTKIFVKNRNPLRTQSLIAFLSHPAAVAFLSNRNAP